MKNRRDDKYLPDVHVKVIGSGNEDFVSGQTDLRGVFVADGIRGGATVIALAGPSRYAFYGPKKPRSPRANWQGARPGGPGRARLPTAEAPPSACIPIPRFATRSKRP